MSERELWDIEPPPDQPDAKDVVRWFCRLQTHVHGALGYDTAADCFCGEGGFWPKPGDPPGSYATYDGTHLRGYRNEGVVLQFIADAVREKLAALRALEGGNP